VAAFYSSLARGTELSHESLEGTRTLLTRGTASKRRRRLICSLITDMAEEAATPGGLNAQVRKFKG
jgi:hypothetical protein